MKRSNHQAPVPDPAPGSSAATIGVDLAAAVQHLQAGRPRHAEPLLERVLAARPDNPDALHLLGAIALQAGGNETAIDLIGKAVALKPNYAEAHNNLGSALMGTGKIAEAAASYQKAIALRPDYAKAYVNLGVALTKQGRLEEAVAALRKAISLAPNVAEAHNNLGSALISQGELDDAIGAFQSAVALKPDYAEAHYNLGNALKNQDKLANAVVCYRKAIAIEPNFTEAHSGLGVALNDQGMHEEAIASLQLAVALQPSFAEAYYGLGVALNDGGRHDEAVAAHQKALALKPDFAEAHNGLGIVFECQGKVEAAVACHQRAIALKTDYAAAHHDLGCALDRQGQIEAALASYERAIALDSAHAVMHYLDAKDHRFFPGDPKIAMLHKLLGLESISESDKSPIYSALGKAHDDIGRYGEAFSYHSAANAEMTGRGDYDPSRHRNEISAIKEMYRDRRGCADRVPGDAECVPIFVVGMSRSGKTSVESILAQHEAVYGAGESPEWYNSVKAVLDKHSLSTSLPECLGLLSDDQVKEIGEIYLENISKHSPSSKLIVNTMPRNYQFIGMILQALPMAKIIYCCRDPMDHCLFVYFYRYKGGNDYSYDLGHLASYYAVYHDLMAHWLELYGDRILSVRYEDLVRNPANVGARIFAFCGLDYDPAVVRHAFTADEIGHWKHYEPYLGALRQALGGLAE